MIKIFVNESFKPVDFLEFQAAAIAILILQLEHQQHWLVSVQWVCICAMVGDTIIYYFIIIIISIL